MYIFTNKRYETDQTLFSFNHWVMPQVWDFGALGGAQGVKKLNMNMWHIKLTGMTIFSCRSPFQNSVCVCACVRACVRACMCVCCVQISVTIGANGSL